MARTILPLAGAFIGAAFGAPQLGYAIGSVIGNAVDPQRIKGPRIGDANVQTSQEGTPRPIVYGTAAVMGNLIDRGPLNKVITEERQGKGGPVVETESLFMTFAIRICEGPVNNVTRIWEDEKLVYDITESTQILEDSQRYSQGFTLYLGDEDQLPDPDLETIHGVGNTPAHRGTCYIVFREKNLTERRGSIPQFRFELNAGTVTPPTFDDVLPGGSIFNQAFISGGSGTQGTSNPFFSPNPSGSQVFAPANTKSAIYFFRCQRTTATIQLYKNNVLILEREITNESSVDVDFIWPVSAVPGDGFRVTGDRASTVGSAGAFESGIVYYSQTLEELGIPDPEAAPDPGEVRLSDVVADVSSRCGLTTQEYDITQLENDTVRGFVLSGLYNGSDAIDPLRRVYFFDPSEQDGRVVFVKRGLASVATITEDDLVDAPESSKRAQALEFPRKLHLDYQNSEIGYAPAKATAARSSADVRVVGELSIEAPVVLTSDEAAQTADKLLKVTWTEAEGETQFTLGDNFLRLTPTDNIALNLRGTSRRLRITRTERQRGVINITATPDRVSSYESSVTGPALRPPTQPPAAFPGPTTYAVMDIPALIDTQDSLGLYVAATGSSTAWAGARFQVSTDGGATWSDLIDVRRPSRIGTLLNNVTAALVGPVDSTNVLEIDFGQLSEELPSFSNTEWLSERGALAILRGDGSAEIVQYRDAVPLGDPSSSSSSTGLWALSPLIRGRLNSGATAHSAGATVVYLEDASFVEVSATLLNRELTFRAISFGETPEGSSLDQSFTFVGRSQLEMPVVYLSVEQNSLGVIDATWTRRDRFGTDTNPILSANWQGYRVTFVGDSTVSVDTTSPFITYDASALGSSSVSVSVAQLNRITGAGPAVTENT